LGPMRLSAGIAAIVALMATQTAWALDNGMARAPPMGWNSWHHFGCNVSEMLVREQADALVASGLRDAGYQYVVIDDCWQVGRASDGAIQADPARFPSGMKALADYVHAKGLRFGLYSDVGDRTCQGRPGSLGHEAQDARTYASWGVDFLKYDWCHSRGLDAPTAFARMRDALAATGRPILFSICEWGLSDPARWAPSVGNMWRTTGDIGDAFDQPPLHPTGEAVGVANITPIEMNMGVLQVLDRQAGLAPFAGPEAWNDPDMLEVGNGGMSLDEQRAQFVLWAVLAAPLMAGNDVRAMTPEVRAILADPEVIAIDQDAAARAGDRVRRFGDIDIWARPLADSGTAVALLNRGPRPLKITVDPATLGLTGRSYCVRDVSEHANRGAFGARFTSEVQPHAVRLLRLRLGDGACSTAADRGA
ncbi:MAG: alpha-galactosidase, partial [Phenylobacterium sp.]|nr:alpha-galactosidase [Phenylobacterium sp.]